MLSQDHFDNHAWWQERAALHRRTRMYSESISILRNGGVPLRPTELEEVGDVRGRTLLHLQCHIGTDSLGWVRQGAQVTGVDFSDVALTEARTLANELKLPLKLIHSTIEALRQRHREQYDVVFTSYGTIPWLRDLSVWATTIEQSLVPGGFFYIVDSHPLSNGVAESSFSNGKSVEFDDPYFPSSQPLDYDSPGTYAEDGVATQSNKTREWAHSVSEIISSLVQAGLVIELFNEHKHCAFPLFDVMRRDERGDYRLPGELEGYLPLMFSLRARKSAE